MPFLDRPHDGRTLEAKIVTLRIAPTEVSPADGGMESICGSHHPPRNRDTPVMAGSSLPGVGAISLRARIYFLRNLAASRSFERGQPMLRGPYFKRDAISDRAGVWRYLARASQCRPSSNSFPFL
jgi:hypothetical protein